MNIKILAFLLFVIISGCAKKPSYQEKFKEPELTDINRDYDLNAFYLFVPSTLTAPYDISEVIPYEKGQALRVKLKFVEDGLEVFAPDDQFSAERNQGRVMLIPGKYLSYKCDTNSLGECTNREVEDEEINWRNRKYFLPNHQDISIFGSHKADIGMSTNPCYKFDGSSVEKLDIRNGMIYLIIARHYSADIDKCSFSELPIERSSFSVRVSYQLIREDDIISKDFKATPYSMTEQRLFGAFKYTTKKFDVTFSKENEQDYLMRINPNKKVVTYYLSPEFKISDFKYLRDLTEEAFTSFNKGLESAGTGMQIELKDLPEGISVGDIGYNMINLITDPSSTGILGFAPYTPNPQTGELIHVSVQMFYGSMLSQTKIIYEAMREKGEQLKPVILPTPEVTTATEVVSLNRVESNRRPTSVKKKVINKSSKKVNKVTSNKKLITKDGRKPKSIGQDEIDFKSPEAEKNWASLFPKEYKITKIDHDAEVKKTQKLLDVCAYPSSEFIQGLRGKNYISAFTNCGANKNSKFCKNYELKPWDELSEGEQKEVSKIIISFSWRRILIHELGHNFGLRHNFKGNFDEENFYTLKELNEIAPEKFDRVPQYSSIMDYAYTDLGQLPVLGKYDVAALRYIYTGKIETTVMENNKKVNKLIPPSELPKNAMPKYMYCTDENVGAEPSCHRHDEGKNYSDLADHYLEKYQNNKIYTNFRSGKNNFDQLRSLSRYFYHRQEEFQRWRDIYEEYEKFSLIIYKSANLPVDQKLDFNNPNNPCLQLKSLDYYKGLLNKSPAGISDLDSVCRKYADLYLATKKMVDFFTNIILTPEKQCLLIPRKELDANGKLKDMSEAEYNEKSLKGYLRDVHERLQLSEAPQSCFDEKVKEYFKDFLIVGERGEYVRELPEFRTESHSELDISAIGIWIDKLLAMQFLTARKFYRVDSSPASSPLDIPEFSEKISQVMNQLLMLNTKNTGIDLKFTKEDKSELPWKIYYQLNEKNHSPIPRVYIWPLMENFELQPVNSVGLNAKMLETFAKYGNTHEPDFQRISKEVLKAYQIIFTPKGLDAGTHPYQQTEDNGDIWSADEENYFAIQLLDVVDILNRDWKTAFEGEGLLGIDLRGLLSLIKQQKLNAELFLGERKSGIRSPAEDLNNKLRENFNLDSIIDIPLAVLNKFLSCVKEEGMDPEVYKNNCIKSLISVISVEGDNDNIKAEKQAAEDFEFLEKKVTREEIKEAIKSNVLLILNKIPLTKAKKLVELLSKSDWTKKLKTWQTDLIETLKVKNPSPDLIKDLEDYLPVITEYQKPIVDYGKATLKEIEGYYNGDYYVKKYDENGKPIIDEKTKPLIDLFKKSTDQREIYFNAILNGGVDKYWELIKSLPRK